MDYKSSKVRISHCQVVISEQEYNELQREKRNSERLLFLHGNCNKMESELYLTSRIVCGTGSCLLF